MSTRRKNHSSAMSSARCFGRRYDDAGPCPAATSAGFGRGRAAHDDTAASIEQNRNTNDHQSIIDGCVTLPAEPNIRRQVCVRENIFE